MSDYEKTRKAEYEAQYWAWVEDEFDRWNDDWEDGEFLSSLPMEPEDS